MKHLFKLFAVPRGNGSFQVCDLRLDLGDQFAGEAVSLLLRQSELRHGPRVAEKRVVARDKWGCGMFGYHLNRRGPFQGLPRSALKGLPHAHRLLHTLNATP